MSKVLFEIRERVPSSDDYFCSETKNKVQKFLEKKVETEYPGGIIFISDVILEGCVYGEISESALS